MKRKLRTWSYVDRPNAVKNLPPYTYLNFNNGECQIVPDAGSLELEMQEGDMPNIEKVSDNYRGLCVSVSDHGNVSLLYHFKNGNTREVWGAV